MQQSLGSAQPSSPQCSSSSSSNITKAISLIFTASPRPILANVVVKGLNAACMRRWAAIRRTSLRAVRRAYTDTAPVYTHAHARMDNKPPQYPERAHLERDGARHARPGDVRISARGHHNQSPSSASASALQTELSAAMSQPLLSPSGLQAVGSSSAGAHSPGSPRTTLEPASYETTTSISRPASLALPSRGRRDTSTRPLLRDRQRSLSFNSMEDALAGDPFAWLRQTVQEQREQETEKNSGDTKTVSLPASPIEGMPATLGGGAAASIESEPPNKPQDYFGWMSLIAGKGTVREHVSEETVRRDSLESSKSDAASASAASASRFSLPTLPSMPAWQAPSFPKFQAPSLSMPKLQLQAPSLQLPAFGTSSSTPGARRQSTKAGEDPAAKYMDEEDRTASDEPDWSRIKDKYEKPRLPMVFLHGLFGFSVIGPSNVPALQIQYWRGVREALEELGVEVLMTSSPASGSEYTDYRLDRRWSS